jgi:hypothetical protein
MTEVKGQSEDSRTADENTQSDRCAIPREIYNNITAIASVSKKTNCEIQTEVLNEYVERKRLESDCLTGTINDDRCKYVKPK